MFGYAVDSDHGNATLDSVAVYDLEVVTRHTGLNGALWHSRPILSAHWIYHSLAYIPAASEYPQEVGIRVSNNSFHGTGVVPQKPGPPCESFVRVHWIFGSLLAVHRLDDFKRARSMCDTVDLG